MQNIAIKKILKDRPFSLILSGGGALGIAHLGVLYDLEKSQLSPHEIVGTSMGGIIGACMAIGLKEVDILSHIKDFSSVSKWIKFSFSGNAIVDNSKIERILSDIFQDKKMSETLIPLKLITTNLKNGHKRVFTAKDDIYIKDAVLATMAIPGVFDEHLIEGEIYGDGFLCENLGINEATYPTLLAIDVLGENSFEKEMPNNFFKTANVMEMFEKSMRLLIYNQSKTHLKNLDKNIYLIEPKTSNYNTYHFHKYKEIRALGLGLLDD
jgi:NTE family protein